MKIWDSIFDNHMHLRFDGCGVEAARKYEQAGGTSFNLVNLPDYSKPASGYYESVYEGTMRMADTVRRETGIHVIVTLGPYPLDYLHFSKSVNGISNFMKHGIDLAVRLIKEGRANAIGEIGRPHFETSEKTISDSNRIVEYAMEQASDERIPIILHTEDLDENSYADFANMARRAGFSTDRLVKHHAYPKDIGIDNFLVKSILSTRKNVREALTFGNRFFLETDYVDDLSKPGKVIPADSVPKRAVMIRNQYEDWEDIFESIFRKLPASVYGDDLIF